MRCLFFYTVLLLVVLVLKQKAEAQDPIPTETVQQVFDHNLGDWIDKIKIQYAYDQSGNMIQKNTYNLEVCDPEDANCDYHMDPYFSHEYERWKYNDRGQEIYHGEERYGYTRNPQNLLELIRNRKYYQKTVYNKDSLVLDRETYDEHQYHYVQITKEHFEYDEQRRLLVDAHSQEYIYENERSGWMYQTIYDYVDDLLQSSYHVTKHFYNNDTPDIQTTIINFHYDDRSLLEHKTIEHSSFYGDDHYASSEREEYSYNADDKMERIDFQYLDIENGEWITSSHTLLSYHSDGEKKSEIHSRRYNQEIPAHGLDTLLVSTTYYDEAGREQEWIQEIYEHDGTFIEILRKSTYEWISENHYRYTSWSLDYIFSYAQLYEYNANNQLVNNRFEWYSFYADSTVENSHLSATLYEYDASGVLTRKHETRVSYDADSLIMTGCCGNLYELDVIYINRCDGAPLIATSEMWIYQTGTASEFHPEPWLTREVNQFGKAFCAVGETEEVSLNVYPNPTTSTVTIESDMLASFGTEMELVSVNGDVIRARYAPVVGSFQMDFTGISPGVYILKLKNGDDQVSSRIVLF